MYIANVKSWLEINATFIAIMNKVEVKFFHMLYISHCYFSTHIIITMWEVKNYEHTCRPTFKVILCTSKDIIYTLKDNWNDISNHIKIGFDVLRLCTCKYGWYVFWCHTKLRQITSFTCILTTNFLNINFVSWYI